VAAAIPATPKIRSASLDGPWAWLAAGWTDFRRAGLYSLVYGVVFVAAIYVMTIGLWLGGLSAWIPVAAGGLALTGPLLATGLYDISRRLESGAPLTWGFVAKTRLPAPGQMAMLGFALCLIFMVWLRAAQLIFAFFVQGDYPPLADFSTYVLGTRDGLELLAIGTAVGACLAFTAFVVSAISAPMLLDRDIDVVTAIITSFNVLKRQPGLMLLWAWIVAVLIAVGAATAFLGLIIAFPVLGHTAWHAYRGLVEPTGR
jgi:uncharacterized membrane protein